LHNGSLSPSVIENSQNRIAQLLTQTPQYEVFPLEKQILVDHAELAINCCFDII
jgi:beta-N-acetylhexosaminidase